MANFDVLARQGKAIFLGYSQAEMIRGFGLRADGTYLYLNFCGEGYRVDRETGEVLGPDGMPAGPAETLTVYDMLCGGGLDWGLAGSWCTTNMLPGCGQSSPDDVALNRPSISKFEEHPERLRQACATLGGRPFPVGDVAWEFPVFDWFPAVFQFWQGDEEFPSSVRFLWDRNALRYLRYETLYYVMGCVLKRLIRQMEA
ncbi:MAG: DUF3786 domain-containing protein [Oscillospiraceae bacterium]|nr:DUF3786 domain-containing protein [Oscillospiraceae bacterium]